MVTYVGIDWSTQKHDVCFVNEAGAAIARQVIAHTPAGFAEFDRQRQRLGVEPADCLIGIETAQHHYSQPRKLPACYARLQQAQPQADASTVLTFQDEAIQLAHLLLPLVQAKQAQLRDLGNLFKQHPDAPIFDSLPGAGDILAPGLLVKFGDDRQRFPSAASVQALAGTCPVTDGSGQRHVVRFRKACDHEFRTITQQWAKATLNESPWVQAYWQEMRPHCDSDSAAYRRLANRWLAILWTLRVWQTHQTYDEDYTCGAVLPSSATARGSQQAARCQ